jgi:protein-disulfide isomerase
MPEDTGEPLKAAKPFAMAQSPSGWLPAPALGSDDPLVVVIVSSDFQCPVCRRVVKPVEAIARELGADVRVEFKHHALPSHPRAMDASLAAMAAHAQGRFWEYHDRLFTNQRALGPGDLEDHARSMGLDLAQWQKDFNSEARRLQIASESRASDKLGARGTPGFFINGRKQVGWGSYFGFKSMVERELTSARELLKSGTPRADVVKKRVLSNNQADGSNYVSWFIEGTPAPQ